MNLRPLLILAATLALPALPAAAQTTVFTYQGRLTDNNFAANGNYDVRFSLHSAASGAGSVGTPQTVNPTVVTNGLFTATLDFGANFPGADRWLQIEVRPSGSAAAYTVLTPRQKISAAPYASRAASAATSAALTGNITASQVSGGTLNVSLFPSTVARTDQATAFSQPLSVNSTQQTPLTLTGSATFGTWLNLGNSSAPAATTWNLISTGSSNGEGAGKLLFRDNTHNAVRMMIAETGHVGIGTTSPRERLQVQAPDSAIAVKNTNDVLGGFVMNTWSSLQMGLYNPTAVVERGVPANSNRPVFGMTPDGKIGSLTNVTGPPVYRNLLDDGSGRVGLGTSSPAGALLDVEGAIRLNAHDLYLRPGTDNSHGIGWYGSGKLWGTHEVNGPVLYGSSGGVLGTPPDKVALSWSADGSVRVGSNARSGTFDVITSGDKSIRVTNDGFVPGIQGVSSTAGDFYAGYLRVRHVVELWPRSDGSAAAKLDVRDAAGNATIVLDGGNGEATMKALNLTGGSDVAEPIRMDEDVPPGAAVVIDADRPGEVKMSAMAYDTCVAGIVSGANGVKPGLSLRQEGVLDGGKNVALTGRVYALADAESSPIKPGDLLVTSDIPGHVMKAADRERSHGAILGKAMTPLRSGRGMVLVLVNLQ